MHEPIPYPAWRFHADGRSVIVKGPDDAAELGDGWAESPAGPFTEPASDAAADAATDATAAKARKKR